MSAAHRMCAARCTGTAPKNSSGPRRTDLYSALNPASLHFDSPESLATDTGNIEDLFWCVAAVSAAKGTFGYFVLLILLYCCVLHSLPTLFLPFSSFVSRQDLSCTAPAWYL